MGFSRQEYWNGLPFSSPGDSTNLGIKSTSPTLAGGFFYHWATRKGPRCIYQSENNSVHSKLLQSCLTLCGHMICSPSGSSVHGILQTRILEWVAMPVSNNSVLLQTLVVQGIFFPSVLSSFFPPCLILNRSEEGITCGLMMLCLQNESESKSCSVVFDSLRPHGPHGILQTRIPEWVAFPFSRGIFPTQGLNPGLLHCRQILYQLSHKESPLSEKFST